MIKIIAGKYKRSNLIVPAKNVRPTSAIKRQAIFSIIESYAYKNSIDLYRNKVVLDIFAGSGSIGLEAISRGMKEAYFYENNPEVLKILKQNCFKICKNNKYEIIEDDVMIYPPKKSSLPVSLIYIDPPYHQYDILELLLQLIKKEIIEKNTMIIFETHREDKFKIIKKLKIFDQKSYGKTLLYFIKLLT
jgi:16S rRNA (guanine966-N2)-methyltransferase